MRTFGLTRVGPAALLVALVMPLAAAGCGSASYITVVVESELRIPDEVNRIVVRFETASDHTELIVVDEDLAAGTTFPLRVAFAMEASVERDLVLTVRLLLANAQIRFIQVQHDWRVGKDTEIKLEPL